MTTEEIYTTVRDHLLKQDERSTDGSVCLYRHKELACAVGCLIADEHYTPSLEGCGVGSWPVFGALRSSLGSTYSTYSEGLLRRLQAVHDTRLPQTWSEYLPPTLAEFEAAQ